MRRLFLALCAGVGTLVAGCTSDHISAATTTIPTTASTPVPTTVSTDGTAATPNPDVIPAVITPAYVNAVFAVLNHINGDAVRALLAANAVTPTVKRDLRAIFNDPLYAEEVKIVNQTLAGSTVPFRRPPGDILTKVLKVIESSSACLFVSTSSSFAAVVLTEGKPAASEYWVLRPKTPGNDPLHLNPTPWGLSFNASYTVPTTIPNQCAGPSQS